MKCIILMGPWPKWALGPRACEGWVGEKHNLSLVIQSPSVVIQGDIVAIQITPEVDTNHFWFGSQYQEVKTCFENVRIWDMCIYIMLQALGGVVERPTVFVFFLIKWRPWNFSTCVLSFVAFLVNIWPSSLRAAAIKINSGQQGCGVRPCGLFDLPGILWACLDSICIGFQ